MMKCLRDRFGKSADKELINFVNSIDVDREMILEDIWGNEVHVLMLAKCKIIRREDAAKILKALRDLRSDFLRGEFSLSSELEDVHMNIENYVMKKVGREVAGRMHTARSRNDQVVLDIKLKLRNEILQIFNLLLRFEDVLLERAINSSNIVMPGYTHLQHAQPITLGLWFSAYATMLLRDMERLNSLYDRININPLGSCALAGTSFEIDREYTTRLLGFDSISENSLDSVASRDFIIETMSCLSILMSNLSRLAEDIILYSTSEFKFLEIPDEFATGSSVMPQKKNPDFAELIRARTGFVYGALFQILTVMKGIPIGYNRDLQEDRVMLWSSIRVVKNSLKILCKVIKRVEFNEERMLNLLHENFSTATELANYLVREKGINFRDAYSIVGEIVRKLSSKGSTFESKKLEEILREKGISAENIDDIISPEKCVLRSRSYGGTSPREVKKIVNRTKKKVSRFKRISEERRMRIENAMKLTRSEINRVMKSA
ncbi:MAG: argininosuccinate lyase [Candidatus Altiarchaeales archaeon]|nr:MAG: argininosuccinate lyase [Candidatus Altiarchaeales archaeon]